MKYNSDRKIFWYDSKERLPSENLAINQICAKLVQNKEYDVISRVYKHKKGVILGNSQSLEDLNSEMCAKNNYEVVKRPTGGSAIVVDPELTLCYSIFFDSNQFGGRFGIDKNYKAIVVPLVENMGEKFSIEGTYYIKLNNDYKTPIAGHALKSHSNVMQFDGIINKKKFDINEISNVLKLRELYEHKNKKYVKVDKNFFEIKGNKVADEISGAKLLRNEYKELEQIVGLEDIGLSETYFVEIFKKSLNEIFGDFTETSVPINETTLEKYICKSKNIKNEKTKKHLGHCFIDFIEPEPKV